VFSAPSVRHYQRKAPPVQFNWRLLASKARRKSMAGSYVVILRNVIMAGVAGGVLPALRHIQFLSPVTGRVKRR
jgi:hypothetical protein